MKTAAIILLAALSATPMLAQERAFPDRRMGAEHAGPSAEVRPRSAASRPCSTATAGARSRQASANFAALEVARTWCLAEDFARRHQAPSTSMIEPTSLASHGSWTQSQHLVTQTLELLIACHEIATTGSGMDRLYLKL